MSQSTPTPDTTARTETAETVTVPREPTLAMILAGEQAWEDQLEKRIDTRDRRPYPSEEIHELAGRVAYRAMLDAAPALASLQHPVGVREAALIRELQDANDEFEAERLAHDETRQELERAYKAVDDNWVHHRQLFGMRAALEKIAGSHYERVGHCVTDMDDVPDCSAEEAMNIARATLSHPPAQDAPGAVKVKALEWVKHPTANMWRAETELGLYQVAAVTQPSWTFDGVLLSTGINKSGGNADTADGAKAAAQADYDRRILAALNPSPPLPEADGEVVAWMRLNRAEDAPAGTTDSETYADLWRRSGHPVVSLVRQSALVSALRERDEAREANAQEVKSSVSISETLVETRKLYRASEAAREKAEQARDAAILREEKAVCEMTFLGFRAEKAEQVAAGLREALDEAIGHLESVAKDVDACSYLDDDWGEGRPTVLSRLRAALRSTEEGKTATPSVKDEEAGRG